MSGHESSTKAIMYAFIANFGIAIAKSIAAWYTHSGSMLAEAVHSYADCSNQLLLFLGLKRSQRPPDANHPLGYGKAIYFWSFIVAFLLFSVGGLFSIYEGSHKIGHPDPEGLKDAWVALSVLLVSIGLEGFSLLGALREVKKLRRDRPLKEWIKRTRKAELVVILGEDAGALLGLTIAFVFVLLAQQTGNLIYDAIGSISIGIVLIIISLFLFVRIKSLLIGHSADPDLEKMIHDEIAINSNVEKVFNMITLQLGPQVMLAAKIKIKGDVKVDEACRIINQLERRIREEFSEVRWVFMEPDITD